MAERHQLPRVQGSVDREALARPRDEASDEDSTAPRGVAFHALPHFEDERGELTVAELNSSLPFPVVRLYMVHDVPAGGVRGNHAHRSLHQMLIGLRGSCTVLADDGEHRREFRLDTPAHGLYVPPMIWSSQYQFTPDAVLLVLASAPYDANDYIRGYAEFLELVRSPG